MDNGRRFTQLNISSYDWFLLLLLTLSLGLNVVLGIRAVRPATPVSADRLLEGTEVPMIELKNSNGQPVRIETHSDGRPLLLYAYLSKCAWCARNSQSIQSLVEQIRNRYRVAIICLDCKEPPGATNIPAPHYYAPTSGTRSLLRLAKAPTTVVIDRNGKVVKSWPGAYTDPLRAVIEKYFSVHLPGLLEG